MPNLNGNSKGNLKLIVVDTGCTKQPKTPVKFRLFCFLKTAPVGLHPLFPIGKGSCDSFQPCRMGLKNLSKALKPAAGIENIRRRARIWV